MQEQIVECERIVQAQLEQVWSLVGNFWSEWHPAIVSNNKVLHADGTEAREFSSADGGEYKEQLTYFSDSDKAFDYVLTAGIEGVKQYAATVKLSPLNDEHTELNWSTTISAKNGLAQIAEGTKKVFEAGFDFLERHEFDQAQNVRESVSKLQNVPAILREQPDISPTLSYISCIKPEAETLVLFLHGIGGNAENWSPQIQALGVNYNVAALDIRGYGESSLDAAATTIEDHCNDILKILRHVNSRRLILVGLSMGSWIATSFAMRYPKLLRGLVLAGGCTGMSETSPEAREGFRRSRSQPLLAGKTPADMAEGVLDVICGPKAPFAARKALAQSMASIPSMTYLDALNCFCRPTEVFEFSKIACPILMVTGEHDKLAPPDEIRSVSRRIHGAMERPDVRFEVLSGAGHVCNLEAPDDFNLVLEGFLSRFPDARMTATNTRKAEKREAKKERILAASLSEFCEKGFEGASMNAIAAKAGVSKPTLYQYFGDKDGIFSAVLEVGRSHILTPLINTQGSLVDRLWAFSWTYAEFVLRPDMLSLARLILGEASRRPKSAEAYHRAGPGKALEGLIQFIEECVSQQYIRVDDLELATQDLWSLILSGQRDYHLHFVNEVPEQSTLLRTIGHGLRVFIKVYSLNKAADIVELDEKIIEKGIELEANR